jgi:hypothetical protein
VTNQTLANQMVTNLRGSSTDYAIETGLLTTADWTPIGARSWATKKAPFSGLFFLADHSVKLCVLQVGAAS